MTAILLTTLFAFGAFCAIGAIWTTVRRYGRSALALPDAIRSCETTRELRFSVREVRFDAQANVLRPDFTARRANLRTVLPLPVAA